AAGASHPRYRMHSGPGRDPQARTAAAGGHGFPHRAPSASRTFRAGDGPVRRHAWRCKRAAAWTRCYTRNARCAALTDTMNAPIVTVLPRQLTLAVQAPLRTFRGGCPGL